MFLKFSFTYFQQLRQIKYKMASCFDSQEYMLKKRPDSLCALEEPEEEVELPQLAPNYEASAFAGKDVSEMGKYQFYIFLVNILSLIAFFFFCRECNLSIISENLNFFFLNRCNCPKRQHFNSF